MGRKSKKTLSDIIHEIYRDLYNNSTPKADFDELVKNAIIDDYGRKIINYMDYHIDGKLMDDIIERHMRENKLNKKDRSTIKINVYLGCGPTSVD